MLKIRARAQTGVAVIPPAIWILGVLLCPIFVNQTDAQQYYASANALFLDQVNGDQTVLSQQLTIIPQSAVLFTDSVNPSMECGIEVTLGMYADQRTAYEVSYFGLQHWQASQSIVDPAQNLQAPFSNSGFYMNTVNLLDDFFSAYEQGVSYSGDLHNVELNVRRQLTGPITFIAGVRYMDFSEKLHFYSVDDPGGGSDIGLYNVDVENHMLGLQFGCDAACKLTSCVEVAGTAKAGMFVNWLGHDTLLQNTGPDILAAGSESGTGLSGVIDTNLRATVSHGRCQLACGYRVLLLSGMATAESQFDFAINEDPAAVLGTVNHQGSVLLHGPFAGFTVVF